MSFKPLILASITVSLLATCAAQDSTSLADLKRGLVLHYNFDSEPVGGKIIDLSGSGNDGQAVGVQWTAEGHQGGGMIFGLSDKYINVPNSDSLNPGHLTVAVWIKTWYTDKVWRRILDKCYNNGFAFSMAGDFKQYRWQGMLSWEVGVTNTEHGCLSDIRVADGKWHHVAAVFNGAVQQIYVDGWPVGKPRTWKNSGESVHNNYDLTIGANRSNPDAKLGEVNASFNGMMDDVMLFNRDLSTDEIKALFKSQGGVIVPRPAPAPAAVAQPKGDPADRLKKVKSLYDQGLITKDDYDKKVKEIMDSL